ncbi:MAG: TolC family protein [Bacteroidetes bacterium]|nr:TolC family protein [Bacteroidota bacterium]
MRHLFTAFLIFSHCLVITAIGLSQPVKRFDLEKDNISNLIPPLEVLIDSAIAHNAALKSSQLAVGVNSKALKAYANSWTKNLSLTADVRYGTFTNYSTDQITNLAVSTNKSEFRYGVGGTLKFAINDFVDRKNQIGMFKTEVEIARSDYDEKVNQLKKLVIIEYNDLLLKQKLMILSAAKTETVKVNMQMVEKEFRNGVIPLTEFTNMSATVFDSEAAFENARMEFRNAYMMLEETTGMKFNILNTIREGHEHN